MSGARVGGGRQDERKMGRNIEEKIEKRENKEDRGENNRNCLEIALGMIKEIAYTGYIIIENGSKRKMDE